MQNQIISDRDILFEDNHLIAVNKHAGILVQGDETGDQALEDSLADYLSKKYGKPGKAFVGVIHRIDRPVSGVVLFAKTSKALARMNELFRSRQTEKTYTCLVEGKVLTSSGVVESYLKKDSEKNKSFSRKSPAEGYKKALLAYEVLSILDNFSLLKVKPETGRHHQIRQQLSGLGHPIRGDVKYGGKRGNRDGSICLHSTSLKFIHPVKNTEIVITAEIPETEAWKLVRNL